MPVMSKILIVDDDEVNRNLLVDILEDAFLIEAVSTGEEALEIVSKFKPDIILLDIMMPGIDGYEVCKVIKAMDDLKFTKIFLVSVKSRLEERLKGYECGADDYIVKPFDESELLAKIKVFLKLKYSEEVNVLKSNLISLFSHETRTPLNGILGFAEILKESENLSDEEKTWVGMIKECGERLSTFVEKTIYLCELKKGVDIKSEEISLDDLIEFCVVGNKKIVKKKGLEVVYSLNSAVKVNVDKKLFSMALNYVFSNAVKFANDNSLINIESNRVDENFVITIANKGNVLSEDKLENIFDEFYHSDILHHREGQGLSLSLAKYILQAHKGKLYAKNSLDGVVFYIEISSANS